MRRKLLRILMWIIALEVAAWLVGLVVSKRMSKGDENSDEFQVAAICGGKKFHSRATSLKSGTAVASMGGIDLDLRDATLDPAGAELELKATMGGVQVTVSEDWAVEVDTEAFAGGLDVNVTPFEDLPDDAPRLRVHASTRLGGGVITSKAA